VRKMLAPVLSRASASSWVMRSIPRRSPPARLIPWWETPQG